jgi:hypothetical protein
MQRWQTWQLPQIPRCPRLYLAGHSRLLLLSSFQRCPTPGHSHSSNRPSSAGSSTTSCHPHVTGKSTTKLLAQGSGCWDPLLGWLLHALHKPRPGRSLLTRKEWPFGKQLSKYAAHAPDIHLGAIPLSSQQQLRGPDTAATAAAAAAMLQVPQFPTQHSLRLHSTKAHTCLHLHTPPPPPLLSFHPAADVDC